MTPDSPPEDSNQDELDTDGEIEIVDEAANDDTVSAARYDITSYGIDFDVDGLVRRLNREQVVIPEFQRAFVWSIRDASRFIESLLLGLPVPGIFLAKEPETERLLVIDGQQRLKSLMYFKEGRFAPKPGGTTQRVFRLSKVAARFDGKTYEELEEPDRRVLDDSVLHATVVKQDAPADGDTSIYHIFERLNSGGRKLTPQEIRSAVSHGPFVALLQELNGNSEWRALFGPPSKRLKDQEMILRFLALLEDFESYSRPLNDFLSSFLDRNRAPSPSLRAEWKALFEAVVNAFSGATGRGSFRIGNPFNAALFDALSVGYGRVLRSQGNGPTGAALSRIVEELKLDRLFREAVTRSTADEAFVARRIALAEAALRA